VAERPLVVTADPLLLDDLLRVCAAAGVEPEVAADVGAARRSWPSASLVLVGTDIPRATAEPEAPPVQRRPGVFLVGVTSTTAACGRWPCASARSRC
jgi:hypothetical protein